MTMLADLQNSKDSEPTTPPPMTLWPNTWKNRPNQVKELAKKIPKKNVTENKPRMACRKTCICSPTSHAGSFRCHLHRISTAQKSPWSVQDCNDRNRSGKFHSIKIIRPHNSSDNKPQLSRFGRATSANNNGSGKSN